MKYETFVGRYSDYQKMVMIDQQDKFDLDSIINDCELCSAAKEYIKLCCLADSTLATQMHHIGNACYEYFSSLWLSEINYANKIKDT